MRFLFQAKAFLHIFWIHVGVTSHQPGMPGSSRLLYNRFPQRLIPRLNPQITRQQSSCDVHPCLGDSPSLSITAPRPRSVATKTPPSVSSQSSLLALTSVILAASAANLYSCSALFVEVLLHLLLPHPVLNPKENVQGTFVPPHVFLFGDSC